MEINEHKYPTHQKHNRIIFFFMHFPIQQKLLNYFSKQNHVTNLVIVQENFLLLLAFNESFKSLKEFKKIPFKTYHNVVKYQSIVYHLMYMLEYMPLPRTIATC